MNPRLSKSDSHLKLLNFIHISLWIGADLSPQSTRDTSFCHAPHWGLGIRPACNSYHPDAVPQNEGGWDLLKRNVASCTKIYLKIVLLVSDNAIALLVI